jgi:hypothetical protein
MRNALRNGQIEWQRNALERMMERNIRRANALEVLLLGALIEDYPDDQPFPSGLFFGWRESRPLHILAVFDGEKAQVFVITAYEPDLAHFEANLKTRRTT